LLNEEAPAQTEDAKGLDPRPMAPLPEPDPDAPSGLLLTPEDLAPEHSALVGRPLIGVAAGWDHGVTQQLDLSPKVVAFASGALEDGLARAQQHFQLPVQPLDAADWHGAAEDWARGLGVSQILTLEAPVGPWRERLAQLGERLAGHGIRLAYQRRAWDAALWPAATKGFFPFREHALHAGRLDALIAPEETIQC
jgi:deoxyribodipyrimidine photo-lyase